MLKKGNTIYGYTKIDDYVYRPLAFSDICLYDWVRLYRKERSKTKHKASDVSDIREPSPSPDELNVLGEDDEDNVRDVEQQAYEDQLEPDEESKDELDMISSTQETNVKSHRPSFYPSLDGHPQSKSHSVRMVDEKSGHVPNMIPSLPQRCFERCRCRQICRGHQSTFRDILFYRPAISD